MPKFRLVLAALFAALLTMFTASAANAAYGPPTFSADVPSGIDPGETFTITFHSSVVCSWTMNSFEGQSAPGGAGASYPVSLEAPAEGTYTVTVNCTWDPAMAPTSAKIADPTAVVPAVYTPASVSSDTLLAAPQTDPFSVQITVGNPGSGSGGGSGDGSDSGALPDTGGSNASLIAIGAGLVVAGGAAVTVAARRRNKSAA